MQKTIQSVEAIRPWTSDQWGQMFAVDVTFVDGEGANVNAKTPEKASEVRAELMRLVGQPGEFQLTPRNVYNGFQQYKMESWPGKPESSGGGGGGGGGGGSRYDPRREAGMRAGNALNNAVALAVATQQTEPDQVFQWAEMFYVWAEGKVRQVSGQTAQATQDRPAEASGSAWEAYRDAFARLYDALKMSRPALAPAEAQREVVGPLCEQNGWDYPLRSSTPEHVLRTATGILSQRAVQALASVAAQGEDTPLS